MSEIITNHEPYPSYEQVASLDPLAMDRIMEHLPELNRQGNVSVLEEATSAATEAAERLSAPSQREALAAIRDLDFLVSSMMKHGQQPLSRAPGLEEQLIRMGALAGTVPRGTVYTYAACNPSGKRRRSFTGSKEEDVFIDSVSRSILTLDRAVEGLSQAPLDNDSRLGRSLACSGDAMDEMISSIVEVKRTISPEFFTFQMRPYFEPLAVNGKLLTGAGGAQMQLAAIDWMLWGCEDDSADYMRFFTENYPYLTPVQQKALESYSCANNSKSIIGRLSEAPDLYPESIHAAIGLLKKIMTFRYPHRRLAQDNFKLRPSDAVGSGTYRPDILDVLIEKTKASVESLEDLNHEKNRL